MEDIESLVFICGVFGLGGCSVEVILLFLGFFFVWVVFFVYMLEDI